MPFAREQVIIGHAKRLAYSEDIAIPSYTDVFGTIDVSLPERELGATEITNDDSPDFHKDYIEGMYEPGTIGFSYRYTKSQFTAMEAIYQLASAVATRGSAVAGKSTKKWRVTLPDGSVATFRGFLTAHNLPIEGSEDSPVVEGEIQCIGKMTWVSAA